MRARLAFAEGSPCRTLVLPDDELPDDDEELRETLCALRRRMLDLGHDDVLKFATVRPPADPADPHDLEYRFAQCLPGDEPRFDLGGSCGHSLLCSVAEAAAQGWGPPLRPGSSVRVLVRNNGDTVRCDVEAMAPGRVTFTVRFAQRRPLPLDDLLLFGEPVTAVGHPGGVVRVSAVSHGNPYVFVDAADLGCPDPDALFAADRLIHVLREIRGSAERMLGWEPGVFPKVAAVCRAPGGGIAVRSISVPSWHPTLALTGAVCLAAAAAVPGTIPASAGDLTDGTLRVLTAAGPARVRPVVQDGLLDEVSVSPKTVHALGTVGLAAARPVAAGAAGAAIRA